MDYDIHEISELFPFMGEDDYESLKADIKKHGQREPVVLFEGQILDGRHRARACYELGLPLETRELDEGESPVDFVMSKNLHRRNLTAGQRAIIIVAADAMREARERAKERQRAAGRESGRGRPKDVAPLPQAIPARSRDEVAARAHVSPRSIQDAIKIHNADPDLAVEVRTGEVSLSKAMKILHQREADELLWSVDGIDPDVARMIRHLPVCHHIGQLEMLGCLDRSEQLAVAEQLVSGKAEFVTEAHLFLPSGANSVDEAPSCGLDPFVLSTCRAALEALDAFREAVITLGLLSSGFALLGGAFWVK